MIFAAKCVLLFLTFISKSSTLSIPNSRMKTSTMKLHASDDGQEGIPILKTVKKFAPILGYYAVMLAPIYGIGLPFFGSMTDFSTVKNRVSQNECIVAPPKYTPKARALEPPTFKLDADTLEKKFDEVILRQPRITYVTRDKETGRKEYIQRSLIFRFPDVITFKTIPVGSDKSTIAIHSYSVYGAGDLGVNRNRISSWMRELVQTAPVIESDDSDANWY
mmetsp:Transcript_4119/g.4208  ORF Transcript_4119/g.4208 Transcript_4119/m.4208 type:complete len:220 (+) Transcript_4119:78-737(+)